MLLSCAWRRWADRRRHACAAGLRIGRATRIHSGMRRGFERQPVPATRAAGASEGRKSIPDGRRPEQVAEVLPESVLRSVSARLAAYPRPLARWGPGRQSSQTRVRSGERRHSRSSTRAIRRPRPTSLPWLESCAALNHLRLCTLYYAQRSWPNCRGMHVARRGAASSGEPARVRWSAC